MSETSRAWLRRVSDGSSVIVSLGGELDVDSIPEIDEPLAALLTSPRPAVAGEEVVVDLAELEFLDSSGVAVLIRIANTVGPLRLVHATPVVRRVLQALNLSAHLGLDA